MTKVQVSYFAESLSANDADRCDGIYLQLHRTEGTFFSLDDSGESNSDICDEQAQSVQRVSGLCSAIRPNQPPPPGSMQGIPGSVSSRSGKLGRGSGRPRKLRQDMRWRNDYGASAWFFTHDSHADLNHQALSQCKCTG